MMYCIVSIMYLLGGYSSHLFLKPSVAMQVYVYMPNTIGRKWEQVLLILQAIK